MLTGPEIANALNNSDLVIDPWNGDQVGPNSYDLRLGNILIEYPPDAEFDMGRPPPDGKRIVIPKQGYWLRKGYAYLGHTLETITSDKYVPVVDGRSSVGRLFLTVHETAGFCDLGFDGSITLEMFAKMRVKVYPGVRVCQVRFEPAEGRVERYAGRYQNQLREPVPSRLHRDFTWMSGSDAPVIR